MTIAATATPARADTPADETQMFDVDPEIARRLQELDPTRISARDVAEVLARVPAPRIILLQGSVPLINMDPFAGFLIAMGYPADRIRNPRDGRYSESSFIDSQQLAGMVAWYYESEGMRPVLIGHSQGGMLARLMATDSGDRFWNNVSHVPFSEVKGPPDAIAFVRDAMFFKPVPYVKRVVFIATPHRGSFRAVSIVPDLVRRIVTLPVSTVRNLSVLAAENPELAAARDAVKDMPTAVENMRPGNRFVRTYSASPIAPGVTANSIVAVLGEGPVSGKTDGVVAYESAHLDGVESEKVVRAPHSCQGEPDTILEVRRILREHVAAK